MSPALPLRIWAQVESITFRVVQAPRHGLIERSSPGQRPVPASTFTMGDIQQHRISYSHRGGAAPRDRFTFTVTDGTNPLFVLQDGARKVREEQGWQSRVGSEPQSNPVSLNPGGDRSAAALPGGHPACG